MIYKGRDGGFPAYQYPTGRPYPELPSKPRGVLDDRDIGTLGTTRVTRTARSSSGMHGSANVYLVVNCECKEDEQPDVNHGL